MFQYRLHSRKGFVLISVLILSTVLISSAVAFSWFVRLQARTSASRLSSLTSRSAALSILNSVMNASVELGHRTDYDSPLQRWYMPFALNVPDGGRWLVQVKPLDDKIPLRQLFLPDGNTLRTELVYTWHELWSELEHRELENLVLDFLDKNSRARMGSHEEDSFINRGPYEISELLLLSPDITTDILYGHDGELGLADYCTIYSEGKINLNVAPVHVMELIPGLNVGGLAQSIADYREENAIKSLSDVQKIPGASARTSNQIMNIVGFKSRYFRIKIECMDSEGEGVSSYNIIFDRTTRQIVSWEES